MQKYWDRKQWKRAEGLWRRLRRGLHWLSVFFFITLFLAGLALALPWKVLHVLALIPAALILIPHHRRKYLYLTVAILLGGVLVWIHLPERAPEAWRTYHFSMYEDPEVLSSPQNAAVYYEAVFETFGDRIYTFPVADEREDLLTFNAAWHSVSHPQLSRWLREHEGGIARLVEAASMERCRFERPIDLQKFHGQKRRVKLMRTWSNILIRSANEDLGADRKPEALEKMLAVLGMGRHLYQQQNLIDQAAGFSMEVRSIRALHRYIVEYGQEEAELERIENRLRQLNTGWPPVWKRILHQEKIRVKNIIGMFYQQNEKGESRISRNLGQGLKESLDYPAYRFLGYNRTSRLLSILLWFAVPSDPEAAAKLVDQRFDYYGQKVESGEFLGGKQIGRIWQSGLNLRSAVDWMARQQVRFYTALQRHHQVHETYRRVTHILAEIQRHHLSTGQWPASLDELMGPEPAGAYSDPLSGQAFVYKTTGKGFLLYGVGANQRDDEGVNDAGQGKDDIVFWPPLRAEDLETDFYGIP